MQQLVIRTLAIAAALAGSSCYTMRPVTFGELGAARPGAVWITREDQSVVIVETPRVFGDTLVGYVNGEFHELSAAELNAHLYRVRRMAGARTARLVVASLLSAGTFAFLISSSGNAPDSGSTRDCDDDPYQQGCPLALP